MAAYALEKGGMAEVTTVLRSNFKAVTESGFKINSIDHGLDISWSPTHSELHGPHGTCRALLTSKRSPKRQR